MSTHFSFKTDLILSASRTFILRQDNSNSNEFIKYFYQFLNWIQDGQFKHNTSLDLFISIHPSNLRNNTLPSKIIDGHLNLIETLDFLIFRECRRIYALEKTRQWELYHLQSMLKLQNSTIGAPVSSLRIFGCLCGH